MTGSAAVSSFEQLSLRMGVVPSYMVTVTVQVTGFVGAVVSPLKVKEVAPAVRVVSISE